MILFKRTKMDTIAGSTSEMLWCHSVFFAVCVLECCSELSLLSQQLYKVWAIEVIRFLIYLSSSALGSVCAVVSNGPFDSLSEL